jgi:hypothetical protein
LIAIDSMFLICYSLSMALKKKKKTKRKKIVKKINYSEGSKRIFFLLSFAWIVMIMLLGEYTKGTSDLIIHLVIALAPPLIIYRLFFYVYRGFTK